MKRQLRNALNLEPNLPENKKRIEQNPSIYQKYADWWHLFSKPQDYKEEASIYCRMLKKYKRKGSDLLEFGCGGGNNASFMKEHFNITLSDISDAMLDQSRKINPDLEHIQGDMRSLRIKKRFDIVFIHDAIMYIQKKTDMMKVLKTVKCHLKKDGMFMIMPDFLKETFKEVEEYGGSSSKDKDFRYVIWQYDTNKKDNKVYNDFVFIMRDQKEFSKIITERHILGVFSKVEWAQMIVDSGFQEPEFIPHKLKDEKGKIEKYIAIIGKK